MTTISVITVTCNAEKTIRSCVASVAGQTVPVEHIIIDGCSSDGTIPRINALEGKAPQIISEPDQGIYDAMNKGIRRASGDIIGILNADDVYSDERVLERVRRALANQAYQACYGDLVYVANNNLNHVRRFWRSGTFDARKLYWGWMPPHPAFFVRRSVYELHGLFDLSLGSSADYELMLRFLLKNAVSAAYIPEVLVKMRLGGVSNRSIRNRFIAHTMDYRAWRVNGLTPYPWTLLFKPLRKLPQFLIPPPGTTA